MKYEEAGKSSKTERNGAEMENNEIMNKILEADEQKKKNEKLRKKLVEREKEVGCRESNVKRREIELECTHKELIKTLSEAENVHAEILACELSENRDKMRLAYLFREMCEKMFIGNLPSKYSETEFVKGLASILSGQQSEVSGENEETAGNQPQKVF